MYLGPRYGSLPLGRRVMGYTVQWVVVVPVCGRAIVWMVGFCSSIYLALTIGPHCLVPGHFLLTREWNMSRFSCSLVRSHRIGIFETNESIVLLPLTSWSLVQSMKSELEIRTSLSSRILVVVRILARPSSSPVCTRLIGDIPECPILDDFSTKV